MFPLLYFSELPFVIIFHFSEKRYIIDNRSIFPQNIMNISIHFLPFSPVVKNPNTLNVHFPCRILMRTYPNFHRLHTTTALQHVQNLFTQLKHSPPPIYARRSEALPFPASKCGDWPWNFINRKRPNLHKIREVSSGPRHAGIMFVRMILFQRGTHKYLKVGGNSSNLLRVQFTQIRGDAIG